jgi:hypothetical protein
VTIALWTLKKKTLSRWKIFIKHETPKEKLQAQIQKRKPFKGLGTPKDKCHLKEA